MQNLSIESVLFKFKQVADWRDTKSKQFPEDGRNHGAASALRHLASTPVETIRPDIRLRLEALRETVMLRDALNDATRQIGFRTHTTDVNVFLDGVLARLPSTQTH